MLHAWLAGRSIARGLPSPVSDRGAFRVDTNSIDERVRWVFPRLSADLVALAQSIERPGWLIKCCAEVDHLQAALPNGWRVFAQAYFMGNPGEWPPNPTPAGFVHRISRYGPVMEVQIFSEEGDLAARGFAATSIDAVVYDRIVTAPCHRRKGLAAAVMTILRSELRRDNERQLLVATEDGRGLYTYLGWQVLSPYSTGSLA